jgi:predicted amidophosphoribosyltransferase
MPTKLTRVDSLLLADHYYLDGDDECYFIGEYTARAGYAFSATNDHIQNLKKPMDRRDRPEWKFKEWAISQAADMPREAIPPEWLRSATLVPVPPSKAKDDPRYDDRLLRILQRFGSGVRIDVRELVLQRTSTAAAHESEDRPTPADLLELYAIDETLTEPAPQKLAVFDDLLTTGCHFKAIAQILSDRFATKPVIGLFIARRARTAM